MYARCRMQHRAAGVKGSEIVLEKKIKNSCDRTSLFDDCTVNILIVSHPIVCRAIHTFVTVTLPRIGVDAYRHLPGVKMNTLLVLNSHSRCAVVISSAHLLLFQTDSIAPQNVTFCSEQETDLKRCNRNGKTEVIFPA